MTPEILAMMLSKFADGYSIDQFINDLKADEDDDDEEIDAGPDSIA